MWEDEGEREATVLFSQFVGVVGDTVSKLVERGTSVCKDDSHEHARIPCIQFYPVLVEFKRVDNCIPWGYSMDPGNGPRAWRLEFPNF